MCDRARWGVRVQACKEEVVVGKREGQGRPVDGAG